MIIMRFGGGLGNQIFQYALMLQLKQKYLDVDIRYDISSFKVFNEHYGFEIPVVFDFNEKMIEEKTEGILHPFQTIMIRLNIRLSKLKQYEFIWKLDKLYFKIAEKINVFTYRRITDFHPGVYNSGVFGIKDLDKTNYYFEGGWQNIHYFDRVIDELKSRFKYEISGHEELIEKLSVEESVCVHVRRGDFINNKSVDICNMDYYNKALMFFRKINKNIKVFLFTDDPGTVEIEFLGEYEEIITTDSPYDDFVLMKKCKHHIISNSTFSYWAAILRESEEGIVIAPKYINKVGQVYYQNSVPNNWVIID